MAHETAMALIRQERERQIKVEGWTRQHDDEHEGGDLLRAGVIYYQHAIHDGNIAYRANNIPLGWPWGDRDWKPKDKVRNLERAGALCLAEQERINRGFAPGHDAHVIQKLELIVAALDAALE